MSKPFDLSTIGLEITGTAFLLTISQRWVIALGSSLSRRTLALYIYTDIEIE